MRIRAVLAALSLAAAGCGAIPCTDPCPGAVRVDRVIMRTQLGDVPTVQCTAPHGFQFWYPEYATDEAACEKHLADWLRLLDQAGQ
jgi:hypothetical protein